MKSIKSILFCYCVGIPLAVFFILLMVLGEIVDIYHNDKSGNRKHLNTCMFIG